MSHTTSDQIAPKIKVKKKELTRKQLRKQLSLNGYGKYTSIETEMVTSKAFRTLSGKRIRGDKNNFNTQKCESPTHTKM